MLRKNLALSILVSILALVFTVLATADTNTGEPAAAAGNWAPVDEVTVDSITFDFSPGTGAPPPTLGGHAMTPIPFPGAPACTGIAPPGPLPTPAGSGVGVAPWSGQRCIGSGWATWSHGYTGDVYFTGGGIASQRVTLPSGTTAVYFYVEPDPFTQHQFQVIADEAISPVFTAVGDSGATYVGVYRSGGGTISVIEILCDVQFASGEFGWSDDKPQPGGTIAGKVTDRSGMPIRFAFVLAIKLPTSSGTTGWDLTDSAGAYGVIDLPPGWYLVICIKKDYPTAWKIANVSAGVVTYVDFQL